MVDNVNPTSQFHPYQPQHEKPQSEIGKSSWGGFDVRGQLNHQLSKARGMAQKNPGLVLGGLAALAIGAGLMRKRSMSR